MWRGRLATLVFAPSNEETCVRERFVPGYRVEHDQALADGLRLAPASSA